MKSLVKIGSLAAATASRSPIASNTSSVRAWTTSAFECTLALSARSITRTRRP